MMPGTLLPNLGAEEGDDWAGLLGESSVRAAARLWALLFSRDSRLEHPSRESRAWTSETCEALWPQALGPPPDGPAFPWLEESDRPVAWLNTKQIETLALERFGAPPAGPEADLVARLHDKAFAVESARALDLLPGTLGSMIRVVEAPSLRDADSLIAELDAAIQSWPAWTGRRYTLKPRFGSSGRGRVAGSHTLDTPAVRGALPRFERLGGLILEPWLARESDLSVVLHLASTADPATRPVTGPATTILGSLEMITTPGGLYRGHCGEIDSRGRVFSGHRFDETLRADAAGVAQRAGDLGFFGPCGVDAFSFFEPETDSESGSKSGPDAERSRERLRSVVEFNARATMGLVALGLIRRALPRVRDQLDLFPGARRAFVLAFVPPGPTDLRERLLEACGGADARALDLARPEARVGSPSDAPHEPAPILVFGPDKNTLRRAHREVLGC